MDRKELMHMFNSPNRLGTMSTSDDEGNLNAGVFGSLRMVDEQTAVMALGGNRSLDNLEKHPKAVFLFFEPEADPFHWKGARVYMEVDKIEREGPLFDQLVQQVRDGGGDQAADGIRAAVTFKITDARPLIDMGA
jgi:hypothetical protein